MEAKKQSVGGLLIIVGIGLIVISGFAYMWGSSYTNNFQNATAAGLSSLMGQTDSTFAAARAAVVISPIGFIAGVVLAVIGFVKR